ncbi:MAG TPA: 30S ribosomal protein S3 [Candidatus Sumerlaeota bacterium]|nr:MAG: 30S ribosomal protein S3 [candidate division BRC1 bacterium ADurb.BinA292]HOE97225.1 30S ribosomal protein S3 [Candidatus Sumerlaeota bacterium]HPK03829.1 30S ribosomal protein S3 [Candidatus Sumerlaeota bacterium]
MGQKVNPISNRLGITRTWDSRWYTTKFKYAEFLHEDIRLRNTIRKQFYHAGIAAITIERAGSRCKITVATGRPGIIIGPKGSEIENLRKNLEQMTGKTVTINIEEVKRTELSAQLVAENVAGQLMRRIGFRRAMKKTMQSSMDAGALGIKIHCAGRLAGAEMARREWYRRGRVPLHTLRAEIDYGFAEASTKFGKIGVKVWIFKGEKFKEVTRKRAAA